MAQTMTEDEEKEYEREVLEGEIHQAIAEMEFEIHAAIDRLREMDRTSWTIPSFKGVDWRGE